MSEAILALYLPSLVHKAPGRAEKCSYKLASQLQPWPVYSGSEPGAGVASTVPTIST